MKTLVGAWRAWMTLCLALGALMALAQPASAQIPGGEMEVGGFVKNPRAEAHIGDIEAVITYINATVATRLVPATPPVLSVYLQGYDDGRPVRGATVEALVNTTPGVLKETDDGVFVSNDWTLPAGRSDVDLTITIDGVSTTTSVPFTVSTTSSTVRPTAPVTVQNTLVPGYVFAIGAVAVYLLVTLLFMARRRREAARRRRAGLEGGFAKT